MSNDTRSLPCAEWAEKLAALNPGDLTESEQDALRTHLASCSNCAQVYQDYHHLANLVRDLVVSDVTPDTMPELPELPNEQEEPSISDSPAYQPGVTSSLPTHVSRRQPRKIVSIVAAVAAAALIVGVSLLALRGQPPASRDVLQGHGPVYYVTPLGGPQPASTPQICSCPMILSGPEPALFIDGNLYRDNDVYDASTGELVQQYLKDLGSVTMYSPKLVDGTLYTAVRVGEGAGTVVMYALHASDGAVLWHWSDCGDSENMSSPSVINRAVYFMCESAPGFWRLYALRASDGSLIWRDDLPGDVNLGLLADQQGLYVQSDNQMLAESLDTGKLLWKRSFGQQTNTLDRATLGNGMLYISQGKTFYAVQASTGTLNWEYHFIGNYGIPDPFVAQNRDVYLFVQNGSLTIYALDGATGAMRWQKQLGNINYGSPVIDHGNLYMTIDVFANPRQFYPTHLTRELIAIQGSDGRTLWQRDIPWNKGKLGFSTIETPDVSAGDGRIYLVDWQPSVSAQNLKATIGAFSESDGSLLWTQDIIQIW